jgi:hypothetical protein
VVTKAELKKKRVQKLARYLGENVPPELVLLEAPGRSTADVSSPSHQNDEEYLNPDRPTESTDLEYRASSPTPSKSTSFISRIPKQRPVIPIFVLPDTEQQHCLTVLTPSSPMASPKRLSRRSSLLSSSLIEKDPYWDTRFSLTESLSSHFLTFPPDDNSQERLSPLLRLRTPTSKSGSLEELSLEVQVTIREKADEDLEQKSEESDSDEQEENSSGEETQTSIPVSNVSVDPIFVALNAEGSDEGEPEPKSEGPLTNNKGAEEEGNRTADIDKPVNSPRLKPSHRNDDSYSDTQSHGALSLHLHLHHRTTAQVRRKRRSASLSSICPLPLPTRRVSLQRSESLINVAAFVPLLKRKKRTNNMAITAPHIRQPLDLPFSNTIEKNGDDEFSAEGGEESGEGAEVKSDEGWEKVGKGWSAPNPTGRPLSWEGEWNLPDVSEVQRMLRLLR